MRRRTFVTLGATGLAGALAGRVTAIEGSASGISSAGRPQASSATHVPPFDLAEATVADLQRRMAAGEFSAETLAQRYLDRIAAVDRDGPALNSVIELNPDAPAIAAALDRERKEKGPRGPLHGIPVLIKDNIDTHDRMKTSAGSLALESSTAPRDAFIVERLRTAGAVIMGKTNLSEWANFRSTRSTSGWSGRGGQTHNPYALDRNPCGSSSGSGAATSANLCAAAIGTETDGSIVCPSSACGLVGIKPTVGLVSRSGIIPISVSQDTAGPMARTVADAAALLTALAATDPRDGATTRKARPAPFDYTTALDAGGLKGARLGVVRKMFGKNEHVHQVAEAAIDALERQGAVIVDPVVLTTQGKFDEAEYQVLLYEFRDGLNAYFASLGAAAPVRSIEELIAFNDKHRDREMPYFAQEILLEAQKKGPLTTPAYRQARATCRQMSRALGLDAVLAKHRLDALVAPTGDPAFLIDLVNGDSFTGGGASTPAAVAGYPHITVPMGHVFGLPVGLSFFGKAWSEPTLIRFAYAFEQATKHRKAPEMRPGADMGAGA
jgi:amidase